MTAQADISVPPGPTRLRVVRTPLSGLTFARIMRGGRIADAGRLPRYAAVFALGALAIWGPVTSYLSTAPLRYTSHLSLILPGSGAGASVNLETIGQASSLASSPYAHNSVSPTETYKRLLTAERILGAAAASLEMDRRSFGTPRIKLVDQTGLIHAEMTGSSPIDAQSRGEALLAAFFSEVDALRNDEQLRREDGGRVALSDYQASVAATRAEISQLQRATGLINAEQYNALVQESEEMKARLGALERAVSEKRRAVEALGATLGVDARLAAATLRLHADTEFTAIIAEMGVHATALAEAEGQYGVNHPALQSARAKHAATGVRARARALEITGLSAQEVSGLDMSPIGGRAGLLSELVTLDSSRAGLEAELDALRQQHKTAAQRVRDLIAPAARLEDLQRDFSVAKAVFASAMARSQTTKSDMFASYPLVQILENPSLAEHPSSPRRKLAIAAGGAATLCLVIGLCLGWMRRPLIGRLLAAPKDLA